MDNPTLPFPEMPNGADRTIIKPSASFKKQVYRSAGAIVLFIVTYLLLFLGSIAIAAAFAFLGVTILEAHLSFYGLIAGIGFVVAGAMLVFFVIKFLFKRTQTNYSGMVEIRESEQPGLFAFIKKLTNETGSPMPKKIFVTANVNAGVFYNSSFWSMFFPVRKNLQIGLGLVNSVNVSEFKAIMAHEFGHFSQRSMKFGSYVYNLNKVIHNMLFENKGYEKLMDTWARMHSIFRLMAVINIYLVKGMQAILKKIYLIVNKTYMGLSREMEYHADTIAAYVSGSNQAVSSLKRVEIGQICYDNLLNYWSLKLSEDKRSGNLYPQHLEAIRLYSKNHNLALDITGLPELGPNKASPSNNYIEFDDPWLSHPLTSDRELHLNQTSLNTKTIEESAWLIFENPQKLQEELTAMIYPNPPSDKTIIVTDIEEFNLDFLTTVDGHLYNPIYKDYFDNRDFTQFDIEEAMLSAESTDTITFDSLFSDENCKLPSTLIKLRQNINLLTQIIEDRKDVKYFYFQSAKLSRANADELKMNFTKELEDIKERIKEIDKNVFVYFYNIDKTNETKKKLVDKYRLLFKSQTEALKDIDMQNDILAAMQPVYSKMKPPQIRDTVNNVYSEEKKVKPRLREIIEDDSIRDHVNPDDLKAIQIFLNHNWLYYMSPNYDNNAIDVFNKAMRAYAAIVYQLGFSVKNDLLNFQAGLLK
jgi:Zn-dependent protease with chaperone function